MIPSNKTAQGVVTMTPTTAQTPAQTCNTDIFSLVRRINRFIVEVLKSQSSGVSQTMPFDVTRVLSYTNSLRSFIAWIVAQPLLDLPETGPQWIPMPKSPEIVDLENESAYDICVLFELLRDELANSQSARLSTNMIQHDYNRALAIILKIENLVNQYIAVAEPLDLPESSPLHAMTGPGQQGI
jgi:hypothetical protein